MYSTFLFIYAWVYRVRILFLSNILEKLNLLILIYLLVVINLIISCISFLYSKRFSKNKQKLKVIIVICFERFTKCLLYVKNVRYTSLVNHFNDLIIKSKLILYNFLDYNLKFHIWSVYNFLRSSRKSNYINTTKYCNRPRF